MKKYFVFSDPHGCFSSLLNSLTKAGFEKDNPEHHLIGVGDYFDRGTENKEMLEFLYEMYENKRLEFIMGNHDEMLYDFIRGVDDGVFNSTYNGLDKTISDLSGFSIEKIMNLLKYPDLLIEKIKEHYPYIVKFLKNSKKEINLGNYKFIHAGYVHENKYTTWETAVWQVDSWAKTPDWIRNFEVNNLYDPNTIYVFGHWHCEKLYDEFFGEEYNEYEMRKKRHNTFFYKNFIGLDACTNLTGFVNILVLEEGKDVCLSQ
jgi:serine/threonine protein phosphatase 1